MKKAILLSMALASFLVAADQNQKTDQDFNKEVLKRVDEGLSEMKKEMAELKAMKASGGSIKPLDASTLPFMQGSYTISRNGKPLLSEAYVQDSGGGDMYLNKTNNMIISNITSDHTTYKVGTTTVKTPVVYNNNATAAKTTTVIKPEINTVSQTSNNAASNFLAPPPPLPKTIKKEDF